MKVRRFGFISTADWRKALHNERGLAMAPESRIGNDARSLMRDFGYTPEALLNNMQIMGVYGAKVQGMVLSHGHFDHFGGLVGFLRTDVLNEFVGVAADATTANDAASARRR